MYGVVCLASVIIIRDRPRDRLPRGLSDVIVARLLLLLQAQSLTFLLGREAIGVAMATTIVEASTLSIDGLEVPDGAVVGTRPGILLQLTHRAGCCKHNVT